MEVQCMLSGKEHITKAMEMLLSKIDEHPTDKELGTPVLQFLCMNNKGYQTRKSAAMAYIKHVWTTRLDQSNALL